MRAHFLMKAYNDIRYVLHMAVVNSCMIPRFRTHSVPTITTYRGSPEYYFWGFWNFCEDFLLIFKALNGLGWGGSPNLCHYLLICFTIITDMSRMRGEDSRPATVCFVCVCVCVCTCAWAETTYWSPTCSLLTPTRSVSIWQPGNETQQSTIFLQKCTFCCFDQRRSAPLLTLPHLLPSNTDLDIDYRNGRNA